MIRRFDLAILAALISFFPLVLTAQSSSGLHGADISAAATDTTARCTAFTAGRAGGGGPTSATSGKSDSGFDPANLDRSVSPCDDFYEFADGGWLKNNPIPADRSGWGVSNQLRDQNEAVLHQILEEAAKDKSAKPGSNWQKIGDFYASCMDETQVETVGLKPLDAEFQRIAEIKDTFSLQAEIARLQHMGVNAVFDFSSEQDMKDSTQVIGGAGQGGLGLPDRQYYLDDDDRSKQLRAGYLKHVMNMFELMGDDSPTAEREAQSVMDTEAKLATASKKTEDLRDPETNYHVLTLTQLGDLTPHISWADYFKEMGAPPLKSADIGQPDFFKQVDADFSSISFDDWKIYLRWHLIHAAAAALPKKFVDENFDFYGRTLTGVKELLPRWQRCVEATDSKLGEALGQYYVQRNFPPQAKARALVMVNNLIAALREDLSTLDWMSPATREEAIKKLGLINLKIGYPDKWRDYSSYKVDRNSYVENVLRGNSFNVNRNLAKIGKPVDRTEWLMSPPTVNAYYSTSMNEIVFPAGILQPPFFDLHADDAINYGAIGSVIGHEMTHGFDDEGAKFDGYGNLHNWWTPEDLKNFRQRGECIVDQFSAYEIEPGLKGNGKLEEGETIADLGGLTIAHAAFLKTLKGKPVPDPIDGFTTEQRFFLGWAQIWAENLRPEIARLFAKTDPHPLDQIRTNGPLSNTPAFAKAFGCAPDSKMVRPDAQRCRIW